MRAFALGQPADRFCFLNFRCLRTIVDAADAVQQVPQTRCDLLMMLVFFTQPEERKRKKARDNLKPPYHQ